MSIEGQNPVPLAESTIGAQGGSITIAAAGDPLDGLSIAVPAGAYEQDVQFKISRLDIASHNLDGDLQIATPLIRVENGGQWARDWLEVSLPLQVAQGEFAMAFTYDRETGALDGLPVISLEGGRLKTITRHFSDILGVKIDKAELDKLDIDTGFTHGIDNWQFTNYGSFIEPNGHCAGQTLSAMFYFLNKRGASLYGQYDVYNNAFHKTPDFMWDDRAGYRLASAAQALTNWDGPEVQKFSEYQEAAPADIPYYALALSMKASGEPQLVAIYSNSGGHALIAYRKAGPYFYVSDPNFPDPGAVRSIAFDRSAARFKPYYSGPSAKNLGEAYSTIHFMSKYALIGPVQFELLWRRFLDGSIGNGLFPDYIIGYQEKIPGVRLPAHRLEAKNIVHGETVRAQAGFNGFEGKLVVYDEQLNVIGKYKTREFELQMKPGKTTYGFEILGKVGANYEWVDFWWVDFIEFDGRDVGQRAALRRGI